MKREPIKTERWVCRCGFVYDALIAASAVSCPKGHVMKRESRPRPARKQEVLR